MKKKLLAVSILAASTLCNADAYDMVGNPLAMLVCEASISPSDVNKAMTSQEREAMYNNVTGVYEKVYDRLMIECLNKLDY